MPVRYPLTALPSTEEPWMPSAAQRGPRRGWRFWTVVGSSIALVVAGASYATARLTGPGASFTAAALTRQFPSGAFEAVQLTNGDLFFAHLTNDGGVIVLADAYYVDPSTGRVVQNRPGRLVARGIAGGASTDAAPAFGAGTPLVVDPGQIVTAEPVDPDSPVGRQIAAIEAREARQRASTTTTQVPRGFQ